jgi:hypothetical protein
VKAALATKEAKGVAYSSLTKKKKEGLKATACFPPLKAWKQAVAVERTGYFFR